MHRYVFKKFNDLSVQARKSFACQQTLNNNNKSPNENVRKNNSSSILRFQEVNFLVPQQKRVNYEDFKQKYSCKHPNSSNPFLKAITWSTALIAGFYASQLLCLYRRNRHFDAKKCFHTRYFQQKCKFLHRQILYAKQLKTEERSRPSTGFKFACPLKKNNRSEQKTTDTQSKQDESSSDDGIKNLLDEFDRLNLFDKRFERFFRVDDDLTVGQRKVFYNVNNDDKNTPLGSKENKATSAENITLSEINITSNKSKQEIEDEAIDEIMTNLSEMVGELEFEMGVQCVLSRNYLEAAEHFRMSSSAKNASAYFNLALLYEQGFGVKKDLKVALELYKLASSQGHDKADFNLGVFYAKGLGVKKSIKTAKFYFKKAAMSGNIDAIQALALVSPEKKKPSPLLVNPDAFFMTDDIGTSIMMKETNHHKSLRSITVN